MKDDFTVEYVRGIMPTHKMSHEVEKSIDVAQEYIEEIAKNGESYAYLAFIFTKERWAEFKNFFLKNGFDIHLLNKPNQECVEAIYNFTIDW